MMQCIYNVSLCKQRLRVADIARRTCTDLLNIKFTNSINIKRPLICMPVAFDPVQQSTLTDYRFRLSDRQLADHVSFYCCCIIIPAHNGRRTARQSAAAK